jgi:hypothetical protein
MARYNSKSSPVKSSSSKTVASSELDDELSLAAEDEVFTKVFIQNKDMKELMLLAQTEREFCKMFDLTLEERLGVCLRFPPMNAWYRLLVHKTAERFKMKSFSDGSGDDRKTSIIVCTLFLHSLMNSTC